MIKHSAFVLAFLLLSLTVGCTSLKIREPRSTPNGLVVDVRRGLTDFSSGVVVGFRYVATVEHAVEGRQRMTVNGRAARVHKIIQTTPENIVILYTEEEVFREQDIFRVVASADPYETQTLRGSHLFRPSRIIDGDSGSALLNRRGELVGLVVGRWTPVPDIDWSDYAKRVAPSQETRGVYIPSSWSLP